MKLSSAYLTKKLSEKYQIVKAYNISGRDGFRRPDFGYKSVKKGAVLLAEKLPKDMEYQDVFVILTEEDREQVDLMGPCIILKSEADYIELFTEIQRVYDETQQWLETVQDLMLQEEDIQSILKESASFFGNPLIVMAQDFTLIAHAGDHISIPEHCRLYEKENIKAGYMNVVIQYKGFEQGSDMPILYPTFLDGCRTIGIGLKVGDRYTHRLVMTEVNDFGEEAYFMLLMELAKYVEYILAHTPALMEKNGIEDVFLTLMTDRTADYIQISRRLVQLGWGAKHDYYCMVLQILYQESNAMTAQAICRYIRKQFPDSCSFEYGTDIVTFFNLTKLEMDYEAIDQKMSCFIRDSYLNAGYSRVINGHMSLRRQYKQARIALEVGSRVKPYNWIYRFNQIVVPYLMEQSAKKLPGNMICHEGVLALKQIDEERQTEYVKTLKAYLDTNLSATKAAGELFIHRSTFLYRLEKIQEILQTSLEDSDEIFYLNYSLRILEYEKGNS